MFSYHLTPAEKNSWRGSNLRQCGPNDDESTTRPATFTCVYKNDKYLGVWHDFIKYYYYLRRYFYLPMPTVLLFFPLLHGKVIKNACFDLP